MKPEHPEIKRAEEHLEAAKLVLKNAIRDAQDTCEHDRVGETASGINAEGQILRVCLNCGLGVMNAYGHYGVLGDRERLVYKLTTTQATSLRRT